MTYTNSTKMLLPIVLGSSLLLIGCEGWDDWRREVALTNAASTTQSVIDSMGLPKVKSAEGGQSKQSARLAIGTTHIAFDNGPWLLALNARDDSPLKNLGAAAVQPSVVTWKAAHHEYQTLATGLIDALKDSQKVEKTLQGKASGTIEIYADASLPYERISAVLNIIPSAEIHTRRFATEIEQKHHFTEITLPTPPCGKKTIDATDCSVTDIGWSEDGLQVRAFSVPETMDSCAERVGRLESIRGNLPEKSAPSWHGKIMQGSKGNCPSVPSQGTSVNTHGLASLLKDIKEIQPGCGWTRIRIPAQIPWSTALLTLTTTRYHSDFIHPQLMLEEKGFEKTDCSGGIRPGQDQEVADRRKKRKKKLNRLSVMGVLED